MKKNVLFLTLLLSLLSVKAQTVTPVDLAAGESSVVSLLNKEVSMNNKSVLHITATTAKEALSNSTIKMANENAWVIFDNIRPNVVNDSLLKYISVNGNAAVLKTNARLSIYKQGAVVIAQPSTYQPLKVYKEQNFSGDSATYSLFNFNSSLGLFDNKIRSFKLKRGYMVTLATSSDGLGYSRVFIADDKDLEVAVLPDLLDQKISFIRVFNWEYVSKKGWAGSDFNQYTKTKSTWRYDWSAGGSTSSYVEYVPIKQNLSWPGWSEISGKQYITHALGYNEPDHTEQSNVTVTQAIAEWPNMLKTGLRVGAPAVTNNSWLYQFIDSCKARNYRVDFVAYHAYWGGKSPQSWYNDLKAIYLRTGCPIWITEWNNGANWTTETWPTADKSLSTANAAKQLADIKAILNVLDTASFIERYSIYNWVQDCRAMVLGDTLTPAGKYYASTKPPMAFNRKYEVIPTFVFGNPKLTVAYLTNKLTVTETDPNAENFDGMIIEKKTGTGTYAEVYNSSDKVKTYTDTLLLNPGNRVRYRLKTKIPGGTLSAYTAEAGYDVTLGDDIQYGNASFMNVDWNGVFFNKPYTAIPAIILGAATNANSTAVLTPRAKLVSYSSRFTIQLSPWSYQKISTLSKDETVPYFVAPSGAYDLGGLKAIAGRTTVNGTWTNITFATPFDVVPVVFASQLLPSSANATVVRVRNVTTTGFQAKILKETAVSTAIGTESVSYFAITPGTGSLNGKKVIVGKTADNFISPSLYKTINYGDSIANPVFIGQLQTCNDDTVAANLRCLTVTAKYANVIKQRERSTTATTALTETAGYMVLEPADIINGVITPQVEELSLFPNPVKDVIYIRNFNNRSLKISIYNTMGALVKQLNTETDQINVSDLTPGCYVIKTEDKKVNKFIKL